MSVRWCRFVMQIKDSPTAPLPLLTPAEIDTEFFVPADLGASGVIVFNSALQRNL